MKSTKKGVIVLSTYSRVELLEKSLNSIINLIGFEHVMLVVIYQSGYPRVEKILNKFRNKIDMQLTINSISRSPLHNINRNRLMSYLAGFGLLNADWVLGIEDDVVVHQNALLFISQIYQICKNDKRFRGINLGSRISDITSSKSTYSKLRYGLHGQAGLITKQTWARLNLEEIIECLENEPFDALIESHLKTGYMVTPNLSMFIDFGWDGTHAPTNSNNSYFVELHKSFNENFGFEPVFFQKNIKHNWRKDCIQYKKSDDLLYWIRYFKQKLVRIVLSIFTR